MPASYKYHTGKQTESKYPNGTTSHPPLPCTRKPVSGLRVPCTIHRVEGKKNQLQIFELLK
jgi:hypothetical protein